jgi:PCFT/HCP family folate transporter-like MFS transporter 1/3
MNASSSPKLPSTIPPVSLWEKLKYARVLLFPVEILFFLFTFLMSCLSSLSQQYYFQRYARDALSNISDFNVSNLSFCLKQDDIVNITGSNESILDIQIQSNDLNMYCNVITLTLSGVMSLVFGTLSDRLGRKPMLLLNVVGLSIKTVIQVVIIELSLDLRYYMISSFFYGVCGGLGAVIGVSLAAVADSTTSKRWLTIRMGIIEAMIGAASLAATPAMSYWIDNDGCDFRFPAYFLIIVAGVMLTFAICWPESINNESSSSRTKSKGIGKLLNGARIYLIPNYTGISTWWRIWVVTIILSMACLSAIYEVISYFLHNKPLQWSYSMISIYATVISSAGLMGQFVLLPVLVGVGLPSPVITIIGALCGVISSVLIATVKSTWEMFFAGILQATQHIAFPPMRAVLSSLVTSDNYGSVLSVTASIQMLAAVGFTVLFNEVYRPQVVVNGQAFSPSIMFWITAGAWGMIIPLSMLLFFKKKDEKSYQQLNEQTNLTPDNPNINYGSK